VGDTVASATVISLPAKGTLYRVIAGVATATALAAAESFGTSQLCVAYRYTAASVAAAADGYATSDSFTFTVSDVSGSQISAAATLTLKVYSSAVTSGA
jgi:hypothetical protein